MIELEQTEVNEIMLHGTADEIVSFEVVDAPDVVIENPEEFIPVPETPSVFVLYRYINHQSEI